MKSSKSTKNKKEEALEKTLLDNTETREKLIKEIY